MRTITARASAFSFGSLATAAFVISCLLVALVKPVHADSTATHFDNFTIGTVNGQDGWSSTGAAGSGCAIYDHAVVDNTYGYASFGSKSLRMSNAVTSGCFSDQTFSRSLVDEAGEASAENGGSSGGTRQPYFEAQWDFASTVPGSEQAGLSVVASPDRGDGARMSWVQMRDEPGGLAVAFNDYITGTNFVQTTIATGLNRAVTHTIKITIQFIDGPSNDVVKVYVDGALAHTGTSWEDYFREAEGNPTRTVDSILFRTGGTAYPATAGNGFLIDNLSLYSGPVPVPPCTTVCYVDGVNGSDSNSGTSVATAFKTIQKGIDTVQAGGQVRVLPGTYSETAANVTPASIGGTYTFGLFFHDSKPGISVIGVDGSDAPITNYANVLATVNTNATNNFGPSGIFIEADNITIQGLRIGTNSAGQNKTIEIVGDNAALKFNDLADLSGSVYVNDFRFDTGTNTSRVKAYTIEGNRFAGGLSLDLASGAGFSGPVSSRLIKNNKFEMGAGDTWPAISFSGSGSGVPWFVYSVGGAVIQGNEFSGGEQYIRARANYDNSQFDWTSYWNDNTYDKAAIALIGAYPPFNVRDYSYVSGSYTFNTVRRIGAKIQGEVTNAQAGDTVLVKPGTYPENIVIDKPLSLKGAQAGVLAKNRPGAQSIITFADGAVTPLELKADDITVDGFTFNGAGATTSWIIMALPQPNNARFENIKILNNEFVGNPGTGSAPSNPGGAYLTRQDNLLIEGNYFNDLGNHAVFLAGYGDPVGSNNAIYRNNDSYSNYNSNFSVHSETHNNVLIENNRAVEDALVLFKLNGATIRGNTNTSSFTDSARIYMGGGSSNVLVENNTFINPRSAPVYYADAGFGYGPNSTITIQRNNVTGSAGNMPDGAALFDLRDVGGTNVVQSNTVALTGALGGSTNSVFGVSVRGNMGPTTIAANELDLGNADSTPATASAGIRLMSTLAATSAVTVRNNKIGGYSNGVEVQQLAAGAVANVTLNSIVNNSANGLVNGTTGINAENNWWGNANGPTNAGNPGGMGAVVTGNTDFDPWLCDGTDTSGDIGFQPNVTTCSAPGSISVTKVVDWSGITPFADQTFEMCVSGGVLSTPVCKPFGNNGGNNTWVGLQPGNYTVSETNPGSTWTVTGDNAALVVTSNQTATATLTNTFRTGNLSVTKVVNWGSAPVDNTKTFQICIMGPSFFLMTPGCKTFGANGGTQTWSNIIPGNYFVTENPGLDWLATGNNATVNVPAGGTASATVTNTNQVLLGELTVTKVVNWLTGPTDTSKTFQICITGPSYVSPNCKTYSANGGMHTWSNLTPGIYAITETDPGPGWYVSNTSPTVNVLGGNPTYGHIVNTYQGLTGNLVVTKTVNWGGLSPVASTTFKVCVTGPSYPTVDCKTVGVNGGVLTWSNVGMGNYTITETNPGLGWTVSGNNAQVTVPSNGTAGAIITNTFTAGEPPYPACPINTVQVAQFGTFEFYKGGLQSAAVSIGNLGSLTSGVVLAYQGEGHNWTDGCTPGPSNDGGRFPCDQGQKQETARFKMNNTVIGNFTDHNPDDDRTFFYAFPFSNLKTGTNTLKMEHTPDKTSVNSVLLKGVVCLDVAGATDVAINKTAAPVGTKDVAFTLQVNNLGANAASNVVVTDKLPSNVSYVSASSSNGSCSYNSGNRTLTCNLGSLNAGSTATVTLRVSRTGNKTVNISNTAKVESTTLDLDLSNNSSSTSIRR